MIEILKNKKFLYCSLVLLIISIALNLPFPHAHYEGGVSVFNRTLETANGWNYTGMVSILLLISGLILLGKSLKKNHVRMILLAIIIITLLPAYLVSVFQKTVATDVYAISYDPKLSECSFQTKDDSTLHGECKFTFHNHSSKNVQFSIEFYDQYWFESQTRTVSLMNNDAPYEVEIKGKRTKQIKIETLIDISKLENPIDSSRSSFVNIILKSGDKVRKL